MGNIVSFILHLIFWELIFIGVPAIIVAVIGWQWWKRLPEQEKREYNLSGRSSRTSRAGGAISPLLFIAFAIKVYVDGNWNVAISTYTLDYVVGSMITILVWIVVIFGIPSVIGIIWWIRHENEKETLTFCFIKASANELLGGMNKYSHRRLGELSMDRVSG